jgi:hypothetical protein
MARVSGFFSTDAMNFVGCEHCHRPAGTCCVNHCGHKLSHVHEERSNAYQNKFKDRAGLYKTGLDRMETVHAYNRKLRK